MTDREPEDDDASDWLASQFDPTGELPKQKPDPAAPVQPAAPAQPPAAPVQPPAAQAAPQQPEPQPQQPLPPQAPLQPRSPLPPQPPLQPQPPPPPPAPAAPVQPAPSAAPAAQPAGPAYPSTPSSPAFPPAADPSALPPRQQQFPAQQPAATPPAQQPPQPSVPAPLAGPAQPAHPAQPASSAQPAPPPAPAPAPPAAGDTAGGFSWGLTPGAAAPAPPPDAPAAPASPLPPAAPVTPVAPADPFPPAAPADPFPPAAAADPFPPAAPADPFPPAAAPAAPIPPAAAPAAPAPPGDTAPPAPVAPPGPFYRPVAHEPAPLDPAIDGVPSVESEPPATAMPFETTVLPDVAPDSADAPPFWEPEPTQMMDAVDLEQDPLPRVPQPVPTSVFPPQTRATEMFESPDAAAAGSETGQVSAIDALFGESQFREYTEGLDPSQNPFVRQAEVAAGRGPIDPSDPAGPPGPPPGVSRMQRILLSVLGGLLALLAIVALFFLGTRLPDLLGPAPAVVAPTGSPSPSASPEIALGPVAPGEYPWDELLGGECLDPFQDAWQTTYVVVECADPHPAQMVHRGEIPEADTDTGLYPGEDVVQATAIGLCRGPGIFDPAVAAALTDAVVQASYPTEDIWNEGGRDYFCFVTRSSGEPITGDLALPQVAPPPPPPLTKAP